jgi:hypothetical protein
VVRRADRISPRRYETFLKLDDYFSLNTFGPHSTHAAGEFLTLNNFDIYKGYVKGRNGSSILNGVANKLANRQVLSGVVWDTGAAEYAIIQLVDVAGTGSEFWTVQLGVSAAYVQIASLTIASIEQADLFISNDRCYVFHPISNKIIEFSAGTFTGRSMGLPMPFIASVTAVSVGVGSLTGKYTYGVELVYQVSSVDRLVSSPSRQIVTTRIINEITVTASNVRVVMSSVIPAANTLWTHARLWRSKNQNIDYTDPANPVDAQGVPDELYLLQTMTRAAFVSASYTFADDSITDRNMPATADFVDIERIELEPLPNAYIGSQHRGRIWVSRAQGVNDTSQANIYYSNSAGTKYAEQYDPGNVIYAEPGDGQQTIKLVSFERDLIAIKEAKTGRIVDGNPDNGFETLDHKIGVSHKRAAAYIPGIGIAAVTNDQGDYKTFGYDLRWSNQWGGQDVSRLIRNQTGALTTSAIDFAYLNGKLRISDGTGNFYVLHAEQGKGWSKDVLPLNSRAELMLTFANNTRGIVISRNTFVVEIDKAGVTTDISTATDASSTISCRLVTHRFQEGGGRNILEAHYLSIMANLEDSLAAIPYGNGLPWPDGVTAVSTNFVLDPTDYQTKVALKEREYRLYLERRLTCNFIHYDMTTVAPCTLHGMQLKVVVDEAGMGSESFDPYGVTQFSGTFPTWNTDIILHLTFDENGTIAYDHSGNNRDHTYGAGSGGSRTYDSTLIPGGGQSAVAGTGSGWTDADWTALNYIGDNDGLNSASVTYEYVCSFPSLASEVVIQEGGNGTSYWRMKVNTTGSLEYQLVTSGGSALSYKWTTAVGIITAGATLYTIQFVLSNGGLNGQFYAAARTSAFAAITTTRSAL